MFVRLRSIVFGQQPCRVRLLQHVATLHAVQEIAKARRGVFKKRGTFSTVKEATFHSVFCGGP